MSRLRNLARLVFSRGKRAPVVSAAEAKALQENGALLVDVRERFEWQRGRVPGARHVPMAELKSRLAELPRDRPVVVHCALGSRSALAAKRLRALGFDNIHDLHGGFREWRQADLPVERDD